MVDSALVVVIFVGCGFGLLALSKALFGSYLAPAGLYGVLWCLSLALFYTGAISYYPLRLTILGVFVYSIAAIYVGSIIARVWSDRRSDQPWTHTISRVEATPHLAWAAYALFGIALVGSIFYYRELNSLIGIQALWSNPYAVRYVESIGALQHPGWYGIGRTLTIPSFVLALVALRLGAGQHKKRLLAVMAISFLLVLPSSGRTEQSSLIVWAALADIYLALCTGNQIVLRAYRYVGPILVALVVGYFFFDSAILHKGLFTYAPQAHAYVNLPASFDSAASLIHYLAGNFSAFQIMVDSPQYFHQSTLLTFGFVGTILHTLDGSAFTLPEYVQPFVYDPLQVNLYTWLDVFFLDFGWAGVFAFPPIVGFVITMLYRRMRSSPGVWTVYLASLGSLCIVQTTLANRFGSFDTFLWVVIPLGLVQAAALVGRRHPGRARSASVARARPALRP